MEGIVANANAGNLARWDWVRDDSLPARQTQGRSMYIGRATSQLTAKHRINFSHEYQHRCEGAPLRRESDNGCHTRGSDWIASAGATTSPEAATAYIDFPYTLTQAMWTAPMTNKILLEAGYSRLWYEHAGGPGQLPPDGIFDISVTEQSTATNRGDRPRRSRRARTTPTARWRSTADNWSTPNHWRASSSYVTGSHSMKLGYQGSLLINQTNRVRNPTLLSYRFNQGVPNQFSVAIPDWMTADKTSVAAFFVQDTWTRGRLTLQGALRYDRAWSWSPAGVQRHAGDVGAQPCPDPVRPAGRASMPTTTSRRVSASRMTCSATAGRPSSSTWATTSTPRPTTAPTRATTRRTASVSTYSRAWTDTDGDKVVDCNLLNLGAESGERVGRHVRRAHRQRPELRRRARATSRRSIPTR